MKQKHIIIGGISMVGIVTIAILGVNAYRKKQRKKKEQLTDAANRLISLPTSGSSGPVISRPSSTTSTIVGTFPLTKWRGGPIVTLVQELQKALMKVSSVASLVMNSGGADGKLGDQTEKAINQLGFELPLSSEDYSKIITLSKNPVTVPQVSTSSRGRKAIMTSRGSRFVSTQ